MTLLNPDLPEESMSYLDEASSLFLRAVKQHYTRDAAVDVIEALEPILGKDWKGRLIFGIMANRYSGVRNIRIYKAVPDSQVKKINAIKEVRVISGLGLTEAKSLVESAYFAPRDVIVLQSTTRTQSETDQAIQNSIIILRDAGFNVEFA